MKNLRQSRRSPSPIFESECVYIFFTLFLVLCSSCSKEICSPKKKELSENPRTKLIKYKELTSESEAIIALKQAEDFLANLSQQNGSITLQSGKLIYKTLKQGTGRNIGKNSSPLLHFTEKDLDGEILYDTYESNSPIRLDLEETILGFKLGVSGMRIGERREIFVHPDLAYKKLGKTRPNQLLVYDVTVLEK